MDRITSENLSASVIHTERNTMNRFRCLAAALFATLVLGIAPAAHAQDKVRVVILPFSESLGAVVADKQGFFKDESSTSSSRSSAAAPRR
jgi:ABC-type nitrate/sulfonate/bicarbonate transport system substrate-binding protein